MWLPAVTIKWFNTVFSGPGSGQSRAQIFANVHVVMEAVDDPAYLEALNGADMVNPDGMPLVWALRALGVAPRPEGLRPRRHGRHAGGGR
jgi:UDP-N-acetyl-D-mannosaminuronic acid transferase (WecB/TagA/CpsF family)